MTDTTDAPDRLRPGTAREPLLLSLEEIRAEHRPLVGGKAAGLAELIQRGFDVPEGFVITTRARRGGVGNAWSGLSAPGLRAAVRAAYLALSGPEPAPVAVAVRSSATAEDLADASFAGQHDTFLDVRGTGAVEEAIGRCWSSLQSGRAVAYREAKAVEHGAVAMAVVVQRMVDAAKAGVLHTVNPVTGNRSETVIEAVAGVGEAVVAGTVVPDHYVVPAQGGVAHPSGCLSADELVRLRDLGRRLEREFGTPQDAEWAIDRTGRLWLTQARPVTTAFPTPAAPDDGLRAYWSVNVYQGLAQPFTPIGSTMIMTRQQGMQTYLASIGFSTVITDVRGWLYWDITEGVVHPAKREQLVAFADSLAAPSGRIIDSLAGDARFTVRPAGPRDRRPVARRRMKPSMIAALAFPRAARTLARQQAERQLAALVASAGGVPAPGAAPEARVRFIESAYRGLCRIESTLPRAANTAGSWSQQCVTRLLDGLASSAEVQAAYRGIPANPTTEMDLSLWALAESIEAAGAAGDLEGDPRALAERHRLGTLAEPIGRGLRAFLEEFGCRGPAEIDLGTPRWSDDPTPLLASLASYVEAIRTGENARTNFDRARREAEAEVVALTRRVPWWRPLRRLLVGQLLRRSRELRGLRELPKLLLMRGFAVLRTELLVLGDQLVERGRLAGPGDVMFLRLAELRSALDGAPVRELVRQRRETYAVELKRRHVPSVVLSDGTVVGLPATDEDQLSTSMLRGLGAAAGRATGPVRVVLDPHRASVSAGEILVCPSTDPGWTPLFLNAAALVTETGGMISHGTTVAREYGIPAVVGVAGATRQLRDGHRVTVDGAAGTVMIMSG